MLNRACPIFPSCNLEKTEQFYGQLGFSVASRFPENGYLILFRDEIELHFCYFASHIPERSAHAAFVRIDDAHVLSAEWTGLKIAQDGIPRFQPAEDKPWGVCEMHVIDPDGNLLRLGHTL